MSPLLRGLGYAILLSTAIFWFPLYLVLAQF